MRGKGQTVRCFNREGKVVTEGKVIRVVGAKRNDRTPVVSIVVPKEFANEVRAIKLA